MTSKPYRITLHWTVGTHTPNKVDLAHYHYLVDGNGKVHNGPMPPEANNNTNDGAYIQHCGGGNTGNIGIALCGMAGYRSPSNMGKWPITRQAWERAASLAADKCKKYGIPITPDTVFTHREFGLKNPKSPSAGKIDINVLPWKPSLSADEIGPAFRTAVKWYLERLG